MGNKRNYVVGIAMMAVVALALPGIAVGQEASSPGLPFRFAIRPIDTDDLDFGEGGVPVPIPPILGDCGGDAFGAMEICADDPKIRKCLGTANGSVGASGHCKNTWGNSEGFKKLSALMIFFGNQPWAPNNPEWWTTGSNKNYVTHWHAANDIHPATTWIINFQDGKRIETNSGPCEDGVDDHPWGGKKGWHGQEVEGSLTKESSPTWHNGDCKTGNAKGVFGAGVRFK